MGWFAVVVLVCGVAYTALSVCVVALVVATAGSVVCGLPEPLASSRWSTEWELLAALVLTTCVAPIVLGPTRLLILFGLSPLLVVRGVPVTLPPLCAVLVCAALRLNPLLLTALLP